MDPTRPAQVDPEQIIEAIRDWNITQAFGSPALWNVVGRYCEDRRIVLPTLRRVLSAGAPVPPHVLQRMKRAIAPDGDVHTPYGATEALPVASISATEVLGETAARSQQGAGTCVGRRFPGIQWKVIRIDDGPIPAIEAAEELPRGEIGELIVQGPVVTRQYVTRCEANALHKIRDGASVLASHGRRGLPGRPGPLLVLRPQIAPRADRGRADVHRPLRSDLQPAPAGLPLGAGRRRPAPASSGC